MPNYLNKLFTAIAEDDNFSKVLILHKNEDARFLEFTQTTVISKLNKVLPDAFYKSINSGSLNVIEELLDLVENKERFEIIYCDENNKYMDILWRLLNISGTFIVGDNSSSRIFLEKHVGSYLIINKSDNFSFIKKLT